MRRSAHLHLLQKLMLNYTYIAMLQKAEIDKCTLNSRIIMLETGAILVSVSGENPVTKLNGGGGGAAAAGTASGQSSARNTPSIYDQWIEFFYTTWS